MTPRKTTKIGRKTTKIGEKNNKNREI